MRSSLRDESGEEINPPFDLVADMVLVIALCPLSPLRRTFRDVPFLAIGSKAVLAAWFSCVKQACYYNEAREQRCLGDGHTVFYNELTVVAPLRRRAFFVPGIYATTELTIRIGHHFYGMPKKPTQMTVQARSTRFESTLHDGMQRSHLRARAAGSGRTIGKLLSLFWPHHVWSAQFPSGGAVRAVIRSTPRVQFARVRGSLALNTDWLPWTVPLLPLGFYATNLQMQLPPPGADGS